MIGLVFARIFTLFLGTRANQNVVYRSIGLYSEFKIMECSLYVHIASGILRFSHKKYSY